MTADPDADDDVMEDIVSYDDLDFGGFDSEQFQVTETNYTPIDMDSLKDDLTGLLMALRTHLEESKEDLINREI